MMRSIKKLTAIFLSFAMLVSFSACGSNSSAGSDVETPTSTSGSSILRTTCTTTPDTCDPAKGSGENDNFLYVNVYEALVKPSETDGSAEGWLATDWSYDEDSMTYTFHLRNDAVFADGTPLTAADVKYTADRMLTINDGYSYLFVNYIDSTEAVDDYTVAFHLSQTFGPFVSALESLYILNSTLMLANTEAAGEYGENGDYGTNYLLNHSAGSGPYEVSAFEVNSSYTLKQNPNWYGEIGEKAPKEVEVTLLTDAATSKMMLQNGDVDMLHGHQELSTVSSLTNAGYETANLTEFGQDYFMMNVQKAPTDDIHVRRAIAYACDYEAMSQIYGNCTIATGPIPDGLWGYTATTSYTYDPDKAAQEIAASAYADTLANYPINIAYIQGNGETGKLCMLLAESLQNLGFTVNIEEVPWVSFCDNETDVSTSPNITNCFVSTSYPEAGSLLETKFASWTLGNYNQNEWLQNDTLDSMILDALGTVDDDARAEKYAEIQNYVVDELMPCAAVLVSTLMPVWNGSHFSWCVSDGTIRPVLEWNYYYNDFVMQD